MRARAVLSRFSVLALVGLVVGCSDNKAAKIALESPPAPIADDRPFSLKAALVNSAGATLEQRLAYSSNPAGIVEVSEAGECRCLTDGDATILVSGAGFSAMAIVKCRMVAAIDAPREVRLVVGQSPEALRAKAVGRDGRALEDVPVILSSSDEQIVGVAGGLPVPVSLGKTVLRLTAGTVSALTQVTVAEVVVSAPLLLNDGARQAWTLPKGTYEVEATVKPELDVWDGVIVSWPGSDVKNVGERQSHRVRGHVAETSALTIENPTVFGAGSKVDGFVRVLRVPD